MQSDGICLILDRDNAGSQAEPGPAHGPGHDHRARGRQEVLPRDVPDPLLRQIRDQVGEPLQEVHAEAVVFHPVQFGRDLRVPLERHDQGTDLVVLPVPDLVPGEGLRPKAVHLASDRLDRLPEVRRIHARRDRPHPSRRPRVEARERVVGEALFVSQVPPEPAVQPNPPEQEVRQVERVVVRVRAGNTRRADRDVDLRLVWHRDPSGPGPMGRRGRDRGRSSFIAAEPRQRGGDRVVEQGAVHVARRGEDEALRSHVGFVERDDVRAPDAPDPRFAPLRVPPVRVVLREHEPREFAERPGARVVRLHADVIQEFAADALDLLRRERGAGEALDEDADGLRRRLAGAAPLEREDLLAAVELERRPDPLEAVRELRRAHRACAVQQEPRRELGDALVGALRRDPGGDAPAERDERVRRQRVRQEDGAVLQDGPVRQVHAETSWAWNRTTVRWSSTRYVAATDRICSARTFSIFARSASPKSHEPRPSPALRRIPWNVTPSCSYRAQARTCARARASSAFGGGAFRSFSTSRSRTASTRSREAPRARVTLAISSAGSSFISCRTPTSVARRASTSARYRRFERGCQSPAANGTMPRQPPRAVDRRTSAAGSSWLAAGGGPPTDKRGPGARRSRSPSRSLMRAVRSASTSFGSNAALRMRSASIMRAVSIALAGIVSKYIV